MRAHPVAQRLGDGEGDQEVADGQQEGGVVGQPLIGVGLATLGTMTVVAGVKGVVAGATGRAIMEGAALCGRATGLEVIQDLPMTRGHRGVEALPVGRSPPAEHFMNA